MTNRFNDKKLKFIINFAYICIIVALAYLFLKYLLNIFLPFLIAIGISYVAEPTVQVLSRKLKLKRSVCSAVCIILILVLLVCFCLFASVTLYAQIKLLFESLPDFSKSITEYIDTITENNDFFKDILLNVKGYIENIDIEDINNSGILGNIINYFARAFQSLPQILMTGIIILVFSIFVSSSFPQIKSFIKKQFSEEKRKLIYHIKKSMISIFKCYIKSYAVLMLITFTELSIAFTIFNIKPVFALAFMISLIDILPVFGVGTVMIPWGIIYIILGEYSKSAVILSIYAVITVIRQIIEPKVVGNSIGLPPVITLPVMFIGLKLFGIIGLFSGPMIATLIYDLNSKGYIKLWK